MTKNGRTAAMFAAMFAAAACGSSSNGIQPDREGGAGGDDVNEDGGHVSGNDGGMFMPPPDSSSTATCTNACSSDLHQVLDCATQKVVQTCPADKGCSPDGSCVSPCDAATANHTSIGCEYYALDPDGYTNVPDAPNPTTSVAGSCYAAFIANTWSTPVSINVEYNGQKLDVAHSAYLTSGGGLAGPTYTLIPNGQIPPNKVAVVFLSQSSPGDNSTNADTTPCPASVKAALTTSDPAIHGTGKGHAFHITTSAPVVAFDIYPYGGAIGNSAIAGASMLLPTSVWDTNYVAVTSYEPQSQDPTAFDLPTTRTTDIFDSSIALVASQDQTEFTIYPVNAITGGNGVASAATGVATKYTLNAGEAIQFEQSKDLSGSTVQSNKPIGAWGGHWLEQIPYGVLYGDSNHTQIPPVKALGNEYVAVRYRNRTAAEESVPWRIVGAVDGTTLTYEPSAPSGAPATLKRGQLVEFSSASPFVVKSQDGDHPFYFAGHMTAGDLVATAGDPETVNVVPPQQFLNHYVFFTDPTYGDTNLVVVRAKGGKDVTIDCQSGPLTGWTAVGSRYEYTRIDMQRAHVAVAGCDNGAHSMSSDGPFGVTVWGWDTYVSYAYPAGAAVRSINKVVVPTTPPPR